MLNFHFSDRKTRRLFVLTKGESVEVLFRERSTFYLSDRSRRIFIFRNPSNLNFSTRISHRLSIFQYFRTEEAVEFQFFEYFQTEEAVNFLFFKFSDRRSRRLSIFRIFSDSRRCHHSIFRISSDRRSRHFSIFRIFSDRRSRRFSIFPTQVAVDFLLFNDFTVPN